MHHEHIDAVLSVLIYNTGLAQAMQKGFKPNKQVLQHFHDANEYVVKFLRMYDGMSERQRERLNELAQSRQVVRLPGELEAIEYLTSLMELKDERPDPARNKKKS